MAELDSILRALRNASAAGDTDAVRALSQAAREKSEAYPDVMGALEGYEPDIGVGEILAEGVKGIPRGALGAVETAAVGASALAPDETEQPIRGGIEQVFDFLGAPFERGEGFEDSKTATFGEAVGSFLPFLAAGPLGTGARIGAATLGGAMGAGEARQRAEQAGATPEEKAKATALGVLPGVSEVVAPLSIFSRAVGRSGALALRDRLARVTAAAGEEGAQEAAAEVAQNLIEQGVYNPEKGAFEGTGESFGYGAGVGGLVQGLLDLAMPGRRVSAPQPSQTEVVEPEAVEPAAPDTSTMEPVEEEVPVSPLEEGQPVTPESAPGVAAVEDTTAPQEARRTRAIERAQGLPPRRETEGDTESRRQRAIQAAQGLPESRPQQAPETVQQQRAIAIRRAQLQSSELTPDQIADEVETNGITVDVLRALSIPPNAPVARRVSQRDVNTREDREASYVDLQRFAKNPIVAKRNPTGAQNADKLAQALSIWETATPVTPESAPGVAAPEPTTTPLDEGQPVTPESAPGVAAPEPTTTPLDEGQPVTPESAPGVAAPEPTSVTPVTPSEKALPPEEVAEMAQNMRRAVDQTIRTAEPQALSEAFARFAPDNIPSNPVAAVAELQSSTDRLELANHIRDVNGQTRIELPEELQNATFSRTGAAPTPSSDSFARKVTQGATPVQLLDSIIADTGVPKELRKLAKNLKRVSEDIDYTVKLAPMGEKEYGEFQRFASRQNEMVLNNSKPQDYVQTFLHEHVHALTGYAIDIDSSAGKQIKELYAQYKAAMKGEDLYGLTDAHEFVAEALTNPDFQRAMRRYVAPGDNQSMWDKFVEFVRKIIGWPKSDPTLERLLDLTKDAAVSQDIDVPIFVQTKIDEYLKSVRGPQTPESASDALNAQGTINKREDQPYTSPAYKKTVRQAWETGRDTVRGSVAYSLPMPALNDLVRTKYGKQYPKFAEAFNKLTKQFASAEGDTASFIEGLDPLMSRIGKFVQGNPDKVDYFNDLYFGANTAAVDVTKPRSRYNGNPDKLAAYDALKDGPWKSLGADGQGIYRAMRAVHDRQFKQMVDVVRSRIMSATKDPKLADKVAEKFNAKWNDGQLDGYGALVRPQGKYLIKYSLNEEAEPGFEIFDNIQDRDDRVEQLKADPAVITNTVYPFTSVDKKIFEGVAPNTFIGSLLKQLQDASVPDDITNQVMNMAISVSPSNALMDRLAKRKNTPGYTRDAFYAFKKASVGLGSRINNLKHSAQVNASLRDLQEAYNVSGATPELATLYNEAKQRAEYAANPALAGWSNALKAAGYAWTLGANVSSAVVDMSSLGMVTGPFLASKYGFGKTTSEMFKAAKTVMGTGTNADIETVVTRGLEGNDLQEVLDTMGSSERDIETVRAIPSLLNINFNDPNLSPEKKQLEVLADRVRGSGHSQRFAPMAEQVEQGAGSVAARTIAYSGFLMNSSERLKREIGLLANYNLELDKLTNGNRDGASQEQMEQAADVALENSLLINGGSTNLMGSRFQQQNLASVLLMYKRFAALMMYMQYRMLRQATRGETPEVKAAARRQLALTLATSALFAGARGMPLVGPLEDLWNMFADEEEGDKDFETTLRDILGNGLTEGLPNTLFNMNIGPRIELTRLMMRDTNLPEDATLADKLAAHFGGPVFGSLNRAYRGAELVQEGQIQRGIESMMPSSISNLFKTLRFATEGPRTLRGDPVTDISFGGALAQALGFAPADYARAMDLTTTQRRIDRALASRRTKLYERLYTAYRLGDAEEVVDTLRDMQEFNEAHTERPDILFTPDKIQQSLKTRDRNTRDMIMGALPSTARRYEWMETADQWGF